MTLEKLFNPQSVAIVGASEEEGSVGNVITKNVLNQGYAGKVFLVNPKHDQIFGQKCYQSLLEVVESVDLAVIIIPVEFVVAEIRKNADKIKNYVIISAGFSETGETGKSREKELLEVAREKDLNILGPNCLGFINPELRLNATFSGDLPESGNIALVSQSGALAVGILDVAKKENMRFSKVASIGNKMQISETEMLEFLEKDEKTKTVAMYLEGIKNGRKFLEVATRVSQSKPVIILKAGKTERSQKAISSHTGALAGDDKIVSAVFEKTGVIEAENLGEFFNLMKLVSATEAPRNENVLMLTNAGGPGVLATDAFRNKSLKLLEINQKLKEKIKKFLPQAASAENPVDVLGDAGEDRYQAVLKNFSKDESVGSVVCILTPQEQTPVAKIASKIVNFKKKSQANVSTVFIGGERVRKAVLKLEKNGILNFSFPDRAIEALNKYYQWNIFRLSQNKEVQRQEDSNLSERIREIVKKVKEENRKSLNFSEAGDIMKMLGIKTVESWEAGEAEKDISQIKFPAVVKVDSDKVLHKTEKEGLILGIENQEALKKALGKMKNNFPGEKIIIQPMLPRKTELIIGIKKDEIFGPVIVCGLGGIYTEIFKMVDFFVPPVNFEEIKESLMRGKLKFLFQETRGQNAYDICEIAEIIEKISKFSQNLGEISEFDVNPLLIYNDGKEAQAVDIKILIN